MKNPWKQLSKISPQVEDGHCRMNNEILQKLICHKLTGSQLSIILYIWRKTWGYGKKEDAISISQFVKATGLSRRGIQSTVRELRKLRIIYFKQSGPLQNGSPLNVYLFNKHWDMWVVRPPHKPAPVQKKVKTPAKTGMRRVNRRAPTKDIITKDNIQKTGKLSVKQQFDWINEYYTDYFNSPEFEKAYPYIKDIFDFRTELQGFLRRTAGTKDILRAVNGCAKQYNKKKEIQITGGE